MENNYDIDIDVWKGKDFSKKAIKNNDSYQGINLEQDYEVQVPDLESWKKRAEQRKEDADKQSFLANAFNNSYNKAPVKNIQTAKRKPLNFKVLAKKTILVVALGAGLKVGVPAVKDFAKEKIAIEKTLDTTTTQFVGYDSKTHQRTWDYKNLNESMSDVLNKNKEYDIDTRIYGFYEGLEAYHKDEYMDKLFNWLNQVVSSNTNNFTPEEINACCHETFQEYLDSKGLSKKDYITVMNKIINAYAYEGVAEDKVEDLLAKLNENTLNGGAR